MRVTRYARVIPRGRYSRGRFTLSTNITDYLEVRSALDQADVLGAFPCGAEDVDDVLDSASRARAVWRDLPLDARVECLTRVVAPLQQRFPELAMRMHRELGRAPWECERELLGLVPRLAELAAVAREQLREGSLPGARLGHRPHGVVAVLGPVMLPLTASHGSLVAALLAGNTVVWKPSPLAAASAQLYAEAMEAAGLPPGVFNLVQGDADVGGRLVADDRVDAVVFVGSRASAGAIRRASSERNDLTMMFHVGAKNAAVVLGSADLPRAVAEIVQGAFLTGGQRCTAIGRVLVQSSVLRPFLEALSRECRALPLAGPRTLMAPLFSRARFDRFLQRLAAAERDGAQPIVPAQTRPQSLLVTPSVHVLEDRDRGASLREEELFGPHLLVEPVHDLADAVGVLPQDALCASLFTGDVAQWRRFTAQVQAGALLWNHAPVALSGRLTFAARSRESAARGPGVLLAMTRPTAFCDAPAQAPGVPAFDSAEAQSLGAEVGA